MDKSTKNTETNKKTNQTEKTNKIQTRFFEVNKMKNLTKNKSSQDICFQGLSAYIKPAVTVAILCLFIFFGAATTVTSFAGVEISVYGYIDESMLISGEPVTYIYTINNTGDVNLTNIMVEDNTCSPVYCSPITELVPGVIMLCNCTMILNESTTENAVEVVATVTGTMLNGSTVTNTTTAFVEVIADVNAAFSTGASTVTKDEPFYSLGTDFLILIAGNYYHNIYSFFDNTNVYVDYQDDGIWDEKYTLNAQGSKEITHTISTLIKAGTRIHSDKPIEYIQYLGTYRNTVPPIHNLKNDYYVLNNNDQSSYRCGVCGCNAYHYYHAYYIVVTENSAEITTIYIDGDNDGVVDSTVNVSQLSRGSVVYFKCSSDPSHAMHVYSDKPFYLYDRFSIVVPTGTDFYLPWANAGLLILSNNTEVQIDINNDGVYDYTNTYDTGYYVPPSGTTSYGSHIHSNQSIKVRTDWSYDVQPSTMTGSDVWSIQLNYPSYPYYKNYYNHLIGLFDGTGIRFDRVSENDLISNFNKTINRNTATTIRSLIGNYNYWFHIYANKPFIELGNNGYNVFPHSSITSTQYSTQKYLGTNELTTIQVNVFNPFASTIAMNLTITMSFPDSFSTPDGNVTLNIEKRYLRNDTVIASDTLTLTPSHVGSNYVFNVSNADSSIFDSLSAMQYYDIKYQITTPSTIGSYNFDPVNVKYSAETWNMPQ